jgi:hypothetical protein
MREDHALGISSKPPKRSRPDFGGVWASSSRDAISVGAAVSAGVTDSTNSAAEAFAAQPKPNARPKVVSPDFEKHAVLIRKSFLRQNFGQPYLLVSS